MIMCDIIMLIDKFVVGLHQRPLATKPGLKSS